MRSITAEVIQYNAYYAHPENVLISMLGDDDDDVRRIAVNKILNIRGALPGFEVDDDFVGGEAEIEDDEEDFIEPVVVTSNVRRFCVPIINLEAKSYHRLINLNSQDVTEPPLTKTMSVEDIEGFRASPLRLDNACHNQTVERHIKLVTEASADVDRRDGLIRQKIKSRKLMKVFNTKKQFV